MCSLVCSIDRSSVNEETLAHTVYFFLWGEIRTREMVHVVYVRDKKKTIAIFVFSKPARVWTDANMALAFLKFVFLFASIHGGNAPLKAIQALSRLFRQLLTARREFVVWFQVVLLYLKLSKI